MFSHRVDVLAISNRAGLWSMAFRSCEGQYPVPSLSQAHIDSMICIDPFPTTYAGMELSQLMKTTGKPLSEVVKMTCQRQAAVSELKAMGFTLTANDYGCILRYFLSPTDSLLNEVRALVPKTRTSDTAITTSTVCAHSSPRSRRRSRRLECTCSLCTCA